MIASACISRFSGSVCISFACVVSLAMDSTSLRLGPNVKLAASSPVPRTTRGLGLRARSGPVWHAWTRTLSARVCRDNSGIIALRGLGGPPEGSACAEHLMRRVYRFSAPCDSSLIGTLRPLDLHTLVCGIVALGGSLHAYARPRGGSRKFAPDRRQCPGRAHAIRCESIHMQRL